MPFEHLPESVQTLYAEFLEQTIHAEAEAAVLGAPQGSFVSKTIKGGTYWYFQRMEGDRKRQVYLGKESPSLLAWMEEVRQARARSAADEAQRSRLGSMLAAGGATPVSPGMAKVLQLLGESGIFRMGGVLVGTQAFVAYGNMLGVRFDQQTLRTQDVDLAQDRAIGIALSEETAPVNVERTLSGSGLGFFPVPALDPRQPSTSFKIRGREMRVDFLTPLVGPESNDPVFLPSLGVSAHPLRFLDYLIERPAQAVLVTGAGILVNVPDPARFAFHKLWISQRRPVSEQTKAVKDLRQAGDLLEALLADRPGDLLVAWEALGRTPAPLRTVTSAVRGLPAELQGSLAALLRLPR
ncbi:MAG TPA: GSU2403 family nucleotidyltransferase fold protein [Thermoanaerobaculia bacterium]|nr:GSU2403 family nucleotidyltransferase fold protein [Thermoanaerobaculia bacterium]